MTERNGLRARPSLAPCGRVLALALIFGLLGASPLLAKGRKHGKADEEAAAPSIPIAPFGGLSLKSSLAWNDGGSDGVDWVASSGGPELDVEGRGGLELSFPAIPWLRAGAAVSASLDLDCDARSPSGKKPYLVIEDAEFLALAGPYIGAETRRGDFSCSGRIFLQGGVRVLDLSEADFDYQPIGGEGEDYWFRALPVLGLEQELRIAYRSLAVLKIDNALVRWKDTETAYDGADASGYLDELKADLSYRLRKTRALEWKAGLRASAKWDSGIVIPSSKLRTEARTDLELPKIGRLRLVPLAYLSEADLPDFGWSGAIDVRRQLSSSVEWTTELKDLKWSVGMDLPWLAWGSGWERDDSLKEWKLDFGIEL